MNEGTKRVSEPSQAPPGPQTSSAGPKTSYWDKINAISTLVVAVCTVIAVLVAGSQLRDQNRQAKTDKILSLVAKFDEKPMREMRAKLACDRLQSSLALFKTRKDIPDELIVQLDFLDTVGLLMQREAVDRDDAWFMFSDSVEHYGADVKKAAEAESEAVQLPGPEYLQGAVLALDNATGGILALVGGRDFGHSQFDRAVSSPRPAGTAFKPLVYAAAFEKGIFPGALFQDSVIDNRQVMIGGTRMAGHLGDVRVTVQNLKVVEVDADRNLLLVEGAVPGADDGLIFVRKAVKAAGRKKD